MRGATSSDLAIVLELLPERVDFLGLVLGAAGLGALCGSFYGWWREVSRQRRALYAEDMALSFAFVAVLVFVLGATLQQVL